MTKLHIWKYTFLLIVIVSSCDIINPSEEIPAYLYISEFELTTEPSLHGSDSEKILYAWVHVNNEFIGAYSLPALVPVLKSGTQEITVNAGIKDNGISLTPEIYPFYETYRQTLDLQAGIVDTLYPSITYKDDIGIAIEDFEDINLLFTDDRDGNTSTRIEVVSRSENPEKVFEGDGSGIIRLDKDNPFIEVATKIDELFTGLQEENIYVYLEINYKSDVNVIFGVIGHDNGFVTPYYDPGFSSKDNWNKIYFNLSPLVFELNAEAYQIVLTAGLPSENEIFTMDNAEILLDNIKLVY